MLNPSTMSLMCLSSFSQFKLPFRRCQSAPSLQASARRSNMAWTVSTSPSQTAAFSSGLSVGCRGEDPGSKLGKICWERWPNVAIWIPQPLHRGWSCWSDPNSGCPKFVTTKILLFSGKPSWLWCLSYPCLRGTQLLLVKSPFWLVRYLIKNDRTNRKSTPPSSCVRILGDIDTLW